MIKVDTVNLYKLFPRDKIVDNKVFVNWYTGILKINMFPDNKRIKSYKKTGFFKIEAGKIKDISIISSDKYWEIAKYHHKKQFSNYLLGYPLVINWFREVDDYYEITVNHYKELKKAGYYKAFDSLLHKLKKK